MALSVNTAWEVRPTNGVDTNGGGFVAGATGTDWSQQNAAQYAVVDGVTAGTTTITSATANFGTDVVGNIIYVAGGTGSVTAGWYQIISRTNSTTIVVDRSTGLTAGTGVTLNIGGAVKTIPVAVAVAVRSNKIFVKAEATISTTASIALSSTGGTPGTANPPNRIIGYTSSRTDNGRVTIQATTNSGINVFNPTTSGWEISNFVLDGNNLTTSVGIGLNNTINYFCIRNCLVKNFKSGGIMFGLNCFNSIIQGCEVTAGVTGATAAIQLSDGGSNAVFGCFVHDNACPGITKVGGNAISHNLVTNNTGATSDGIISASSGSTGTAIRNNTVYGSGRHGVFLNVASPIPALIRNNLLVNNGGFGLNMASAAGIAAAAEFDGNAYFNNTSGTRTNADDTSTNPINGVSPYTNTLDVILTADPFTNAAGGDFTLNTNAGGGAAARAAGTPSTFVGVTGTPGHIDMGVFQHSDTIAVINQVINRYSYDGEV